MLEPHIANERLATLLNAEKRRREALVERDFDTLRELLSLKLTHTHTTGATETYEHFMALLAGPMRYLEMAIESVTVRFHGPSAILTGLQTTVGKMGNGPTVASKAQVLQVWVESDAGWQLEAFQGTKLP